MQNKLKAAAMLANLNLQLIEVHGIKDGACTCYKGKECSSAGKHPIHNDWKNHPIALEELKIRLQQNPSMNIGFIPDESIVVVDVDVKNGGLESYESIKPFCKPTFKVKTGGGGFHLAYRLPAGYDNKIKNRPLMQGIDIKTSGGFLVAPGSLHKSGNYYEIAKDSLDEIHVISTELLDLITKEKSYEHASLIQNNSELVDYFGEGGRNIELTSMAGKLFRRGLSYDAVLRILLSYNDSAFSPPLSRKEIESIIRSVFKYKNNEQEVGSEKDLETPKGKIRELLHNPKLNANKRNEIISDLIIKELCNQGKFYKAYGNYFYFHSEIKKLLSIHIENINYKSLLAQYGINASTSYYNYIYQSIVVHCETVGKETQVFKYAHYDAENNIVYLKNKEGMYKITSDTVSYCDNGTDGVLFSDLIEVDYYKFIEALDDQDYIGQLITSLGKYDHNYMNAESQKLLVKCYFVALLMPEFLGTKPITQKAAQKLPC